MYLRNIGERCCVRGEIYCEGGGMEGEGELVMWLVGEWVSGLVQIRWGLGYGYMVMWLCG
jgi:hypothetical protein